MGRECRRKWEKREGGNKKREGRRNRRKR